MDLKQPRRFEEVCERPESSYVCVHHPREEGVANLAERKRSGQRGVLCVGVIHRFKGEPFFKDVSWWDASLEEIQSVIRALVPFEP